jgi:tetratricopeptide (TPR) repeat protein
LEQNHGQNSQDYIWAKISLANSVVRLGRRQEGNQIAKDAYILARRFCPGSSLYQGATQALASSFGYLDDRENEEKLLRELFQYRLTALGPKHVKTIKVIRKLCFSMVGSKRYLESEGLLRIALELSSDATDISDREQCIIRENLGKSLYSQGKYADSEALLRETAKFSERTLGIEHKETLRSKILLGKILRIRKLLSESCDIFLNIIEVQVKTVKEIRGKTIRAMAYLSLSLIEMKKMDDAYKWMRQALCYCVEIGELENDRAEQFFEDLSSIDEPGEHHKLILKLFKKMCNKITWMNAVRHDRVLSALSPQPCLLLLDAQRKSSYPSASATDTGYLHDGSIS